MRGVTVHFSLQPLRSLQAHSGAGQKLADVHADIASREGLARSAIAASQHDDAPASLARPALHTTGASSARVVRRLWESSLDGERDDRHSGNGQRDDIDRDG